MNRHHPYGGYDERPSRGGRGGMRGRPPPHGGMSPPPSSGYPSAQSAYNPSGANMNDPSALYQPQNAYGGSTEFAGGPDRHYQLPMSGGAAGPHRGGMSGRGGPPGSRPPPPPPGQNLNAPPSYGYTPASFEPSPYNAPGPYDQSSAPPAPYGQPPQQGPGYSQDYNPPGSQPGPPPAGYEDQGYSGGSSYGQGFRQGGLPQGSYGLRDRL
ncbi:hypothetical protein [Sporisorium scitamineum]|uniref:Uncharacterized protein n=1 Tax=Sporisorium scitamineum TaxID=49012 RepID=A0A0F7S155_9BASI|nr:hypothetical protein [Sporisorium scitamineum]